MSPVRGVGHHPITRPANPKPNWRGSGGPIKMMYGIVMNRMGVMSNEVQAGVDLAKTALKSGQLTANQTADVKKALVALNAAAKDLKVPGGKLPKETKDSGKSPMFKPPGGIVALYAIYMTKQIHLLRGNVRDTLGFVETSIKSGQLKGIDLTDAKQVRIDLKNALHAMTPPAR